MASRIAWVAAGIVARLMMIAALVMSVRFKYANYTRISSEDDYFKPESYTYVVAAAIIGVAGSVMQIHVSIYLLCKSKKMLPSVIILDISMYADIVISIVLASGVGAGFGATDDALQYVHRIKWNTTDAEGNHISYDAERDLISYYHRGSVAVVFLLIGTVMSVCATIVSIRILATAS